MKNALIIALATVVASLSLALTVNKPSQKDITVEVTPVPTATPVNSKEYKIRALNLEGENVVTLLDEVNSFTVNEVIKAINDFNKKNSKPIYLVMDSPGGSVFDGARLITTIEASKNPVNAINVGLCASMCFMILEHSQVRLAVNRTILMAHPASLQMMVNGEVDKIHSRISFLKRFVDKMDIYIAKRSGMTYEVFKAKSMAESWKDSEDALADNILDEIVSLNTSELTNYVNNKNHLKAEINLKDF